MLDLGSSAGSAFLLLTWATDEARLVFPDGKVVRCCSYDDYYIWLGKLPYPLPSDLGVVRRRGRVALPFPDVYFLGSLSVAREAPNASS